MIYLPTCGPFLGKMLVNIAYMEHMGKSTQHVPLECASRADVFLVIMTPKQIRPMERPIVSNFAQQLQCGSPQ